MSPVDQYRPRTGRRPRPRSDCALIGSRRGAPLDNLVTARSKQRAYPFEDEDDDEYEDDCKCAATASWLQAPHLSN